MNVFHDQEVHSRGLARIERPDDVRMVQSADRLHLAAEPSHGLGIVKVAVGQDFDGDCLAEQYVACPVDYAHASLAQLLQKFIVAQPAALHDVAENRLDLRSIVRKAAAVLFQAERFVALVPSRQFNFQQGPEQPLPLRLGAPPRKSSIRGRLPAQPHRLELIAQSFDFNEAGNLRSGFLPPARIAHCGTSTDQMSRMVSSLRCMLRCEQPTCPAISAVV